MVYIIEYCDGFQDISSALELSVKLYSAMKFKDEKIVVDVNADK